ncbi:MAG: hypothetical protein JRI97_08755, partial [Deltaproteobacteria bacterium]|nr:hypothetical protein [Deltaproteobacteria bacterium]
MAQPDEIRALVQECDDDDSLKAAVHNRVRELVDAAGFANRLVLVLHEDQRLLRKPHANPLFRAAPAAGGKK